MRGIAVATAIGGGIAAFIIGGAGLALADDDDDRNRARAGARQVAVNQSATQSFELEIDPELDAQFPNRPVNGARAARIATDALGGGEVTEVELEAEDGRPYWEVKTEFQGREFELNVDAFDGQLLSDR